MELNIKANIPLTKHVLSVRIVLMSLWQSNKLSPPSFRGETKGELSWQKRKAMIQKRLWRKRAAIKSPRLRKSPQDRPGTIVPMERPWEEGNVAKVWNNTILSVNHNFPAVAYLVQRGSPYFLKDERKKSKK